MAYFGRRPKKPGSVPGAASGGPEERVEAKLTGLLRKAARERTARPIRSLRSARAERGQR